jgi:hypothetical protein
VLKVYSAINFLIERDMITYRIKECPEEDLMDTGDALIEQTKKDWRLEALRTQKRKVTLAYGLPGDLNTLSANELDAKMDQIEQMEDDLKIDECGRARPVDMSDSQWSNRKCALVETAKNRPQEDDEHEDAPYAGYTNPPGAAFQAAEAMETAIESLKALLPLIIWPALTCNGTKRPTLCTVPYTRYLYRYMTHRSNWTTYKRDRWHYAHSENGYNDSKISLEWLARVFDPQTRERANGKPRVLVVDGFGTHETLEVLDFCLANNVILCRLPSHTSYKL